MNDIPSFEEWQRQLHESKVQFWQQRAEMLEGEDIKTIVAEQEKLEDEISQLIHKRNPFTVLGALAHALVRDGAMELYGPNDWPLAGTMSLIGDLIEKEWREFLTDQNIDPPNIHGAIRHDEILREARRESWRKIQEERR